MQRHGKSMGSDFTITWTDLALEELQEMVDYLYTKLQKRKQKNWVMKLKGSCQSLFIIRLFFLYQIRERLEKQQFLSTMPCIIEL